eukprot:Skav203249  [mRNA]  locus=C9179937:1014:1771:- [translate_table: standard]
MLFGTTLIGALHMLMIQFPIIRDELSWGYVVRACFLCVYVLTLGCLVYCVLCDPGKLPVKEMEAFVQTHASGELPRRNELANEYKHNLFHVLRDSRLVSNA